jgi:hypothetical protein
MIAVEVSLNGEQLTVAGSDELAVLSTVINASGKLGPKSHGTKSEDSDYNLSMRVGGLTSRGGGQEDEHPLWVERTQLSIGDVVTVRLVEVSNADAAVSATSAGENVNDTNERRWYEMAKKAYFELRDKYE